MAIPKAIRARPSAGFTIIELLVVSAIIALLTSLLLPTLKLVRDEARAAACASNMRQIGRANTSYALDFNDHVPSPATVGFARTLGGYGDHILPTTAWDTFSSLLPYIGLNPKPTRNGRLLQTAAGVFHCPSNGMLAVPWSDGTPVGPEGGRNPEGTLPPGLGELGIMQAMSYGVPVTMLVAGENWSGYFAQQFGLDGYPYCVSPMRGAGPGGDPLAGVTLPPAHIPKSENVGRFKDSKIYIADGTRFVAPESIRTDVSLEGRGHFAADGGWSRDSHEYSEEVDPRGGLRPFQLSYRHHNGQGLNACFYDGHIERLARRRSHYAGYWYPSGTEIIEDNGLIDPNDPDQADLYLGPGDRVP